MPLADGAALQGAAFGSWLWSPWRALAQSTVAAWFSPVPGVRVVQADGTHTLWRGGQRRSASPRAVQGAPFVAVALPESERLEYTLRLPEMAPADVERALALDVQSASPFEPQDLAWGFRSLPKGPGSVEHRVLLASRARIGARLTAVAPTPQAALATEVWAFDGDGEPVVLRGFGEQRRLRRTTWGRRTVLALLLLAGLLAAAIAITPTLRLELQARQARAAMAELETRLSPLLGQRETLVRLIERHEALRVQMDDRVQPLAVLDLLTQAIGDDSWVQRLQVQGGRVTLVGQTPNAAALMNRLSGHPMVRDVRAPVPATRATGGRENFQIELTLVGTALRPAGVAPGAASAPTAVGAAASQASGASK